MNLDWTYLAPALILGTFGWMLYWFGLPMVGAVAGGGLGASLGMLGAGQMDAGWATLVLPAAGFVLGAVLGFILVRAVQTYLFFAAGASLGGAVGYKLLEMPGIQRLLDTPGPLLVFLVVGAMALFGGMVCLRLRRYIVAIVTSVIADFMLVLGLPEEWKAPGMVIGLVVFLAIQIGLVNKFVDQETFDRRTRYRLRHDRPDVRTVD